MKVVSFTLLAEQDARLARLAQRDCRSKSFVARDAIEDYLVRDERRHGGAQERATR